MTDLNLAVAINNFSFMTYTVWSELGLHPTTYFHSSVTKRDRAKRPVNKSREIITLYNTIS